MGGKIYSGTYTSTILLTNASQDPVTLTGAIIVAGTNASSDSGFYSNAAIDWSISNQGSITATGVTSYGIALLDGGTIVNGSVGGSGGSIRSDETGILLTGALGMLTNDGSIVGTAGRGVFLESGGTVTNGAAGATGALIEGGFEGVAIYNAGGLLTNMGTILATGTFGLGVELYAGTVSNLAGGVIGGTYGVGFVARQTAGTLTNAGTITGRGRDGVAFSFGGTVTNSGVVTGAIAGVLALGGRVSVTNSGSIGGVYAGVDLTAGGGVLNRTGGTITGGFGVTFGEGSVAGLTGAVANAGTILGNVYEGILLQAGGTVSNAGSVYGRIAGIAALHAAASVTNTSRVLSRGVGIDLVAGGTLTNGAGASIAGEYGIVLGNVPSGMAGTPFSVTNAGTITGSGSFGAALLTNGSFVNNGVVQGGSYGVYVDSVTGTVANYGSIGGRVGVYAREVVTDGGQYPGQLKIINAGTITGSGGTAVSLFASDDLLVDEPGAVFNGAVIGGGGRLELGVGTTAGGTLGSLVGSLASFATVTVDGAADWALGGTIATSATLIDLGQARVVGTSLLLHGTLAGAGTLAIGAHGTLIADGTMSGGVVAFTSTSARLVLSHPTLDAETQVGFSAGETINLPDTPFGGLTKSYSGTTSSGTLTLRQGMTVVANLAFEGDYTTTSFSLAAAAGGGTDLFIPCFLAGTRIAVADGSLPVEQLRPGMELLTQSGRLRPIVWVGRRSVDVARHFDPDSVRPVRIAAGAFGPGVPRRDLVLSPDHAVLHDGALIPVHLLVTGGSVRREAVGYARYHHVELASHDILLAEDMPVESYRDTGNRVALAAVGEVPRAATGEACAPMMLGGAAVARARRHLLARWRRRGDIGAVTLSVDGMRLIAARQVGARLMFLLPSAAESVRVVATDECRIAGALLDGVVVAWPAAGPWTLPAPTGSERSLELVVSDGCVA